VSPASPENAINVCLFNCLVLSSEALRMVAPLIAALEVAMRVKSLPVMPSRTSLKRRKSVSTPQTASQGRSASHMLKLMKNEAVSGALEFIKATRVCSCLAELGPVFPVCRFATLGENFKFLDSIEIYLTNWRRLGQLGRGT
jgi:hypothetical protein